MQKNIAYQSLHQALEKTRTITIGSLTAVFVFVALVYQHAPNSVILIWFVFMVVQQLIRQLYSNYLLRNIQEDENLISQQVQYYQFFVLLSALGWGSLGPLFVVGSEDYAAVVYVLAYSIGVMAGSIFSLATIPRYFYTFIIAFKLPIILSLLITGHFDLALIGMIFFIFSIQSGREVQQSVLKNLELNFKNDKLIEDLQASDKLKSEFLANMSHEIRTPMNAILGFIQILKGEETNKEKQQYLDTISNSGSDLLQIIDDILDFSKIESNQMAVELIAFDPTERIKQSVNLFQSQANTKQIGLTLELSDSVPENIVSDPTRFIQVINNLISNALKFSPAHSHVSVKVDYDTKEQILKACVTDEGIGIAKDQLSNIFEPFTQADNSTTRQFGGTGLGLSICSGLIKKLGGDISVRSEIGNGSEFLITVPAKAINKPQVKKVLSTNKTSLLLNGHILIVEDNKTNQLLITKLVEKVGLTYEIANDGLEAMYLYGNNKYSLILMDENMPNMSGIESTAQIRIIEKQLNANKTPIIALTANSLKEDKQRFLESGMDDYLSKPINVALFYKTLQQYLPSK